MGSISNASRKLSVVWKDDHPRRFQYTWFSLFASWLEYSPLKDATYCLPCYLFSKKPSGRPDSVVFIVTCN